MYYSGPFPCGAEVEHLGGGSVSRVELVPTADGTGWFATLGALEWQDLGWRASAPEARMSVKKEMAEMIFPNIQARLCG